MTIRLRWQPGLLIATLLACGGDDPVTPTPDVSAALGISGRYDVRGTTVEVDSGSEREISGTIILLQQGDSYSATFDLDTLFPTQEGTLQAEVIGTGSGSIEGRTLTGEAITQVVISSVPGVDPGFAFVPRTTTTRIVSRSITTISADGTTEIRIENDPAPGESYAKTVTTLKGKKVSASNIHSNLERAPADAEPSD
jgi:hypothetical protein